MTLDRPETLERCDVLDDDAMEPNRQVVIVPKSHREYLSDKQTLDYYEYRKKFLVYLLKIGKNPQKAKGYAPHTVYNTGYRAAGFDLWTWKNRGGYSIPPDSDDASAYMERVAFQDVSEATKGKKLEMLRRYSKWLQHQYDYEEWEFDWNFQSGGGNTGPRDFLTREERRKIRQAALEMDGFPKYGISDDVELTEMVEEGDSWKYTSLVWTSLDAGLRPVEVGEARVQWVDTENGVLRIPREESSKNEGNWIVGLTDRTTKALSQWLEERSNHPRYEDTDKLWRTNHGNRYGSKELGRLLRKLCESTEIDSEGRLSPVSVSSRVSVSG